MREEALFRAAFLVLFFSKKRTRKIKNENINLPQTFLLLQIYHKTKRFLPKILMGQAVAALPSK